MDKIEKVQLAKGYNIFLNGLGPAQKPRDTADLVKIKSEDYKAPKKTGQSAYLTYNSGADV